MFEIEQVQVIPAMKCKFTTKAWLFYRLTKVLGMEKNELGEKPKQKS